MINKFLTVLLVLAGGLLLAVSVSGFVSDAEISSQRLGSDFADAKFRRFDELSMERASQRSRRETIGLEAVSGLGLMVVAMVFYSPEPRRRRSMQVVEPGAVTTPMAHLTQDTEQDTERRFSVPMTRAGEPLVVQRRRPKSSVYEQPRKVG